jgi:ATP-dependent DNA helicase RecG
MDLTNPVEKLFMIGPTYVNRLNKLGIITAEDLLYHFPFRYIDYSLVSPIAQVQPGEMVTIQGEMVGMKNEYTGRGRKIQKGRVADRTGEMEVTWFNQPFLVKTLKLGSRVSLSGKVDWFGRKIVMVSPEYEVIRGEKTVHTGRLVPVYHETYRLSSKWLRSRIAPLLKQIADIKDFLPPRIKKKYQLLDFVPALQQIHFPQSQKEIKEARKRFAFEEKRPGKKRKLFLSSKLTRKRFSSLWLICRLN